MANRTRNKLQRVHKNSKSDKYLDSKKGLYFDILKWSSLYEENLNDRLGTNSIDQDTIRSYKFFLKALKNFTYKNYNSIDINLSDIDDELYFNRFLEWVEYYQYNFSFGSDDYISDTINDFLDYCEGNQGKDVEVLQVEFINSYEGKEDYDSVENIIGFFVDDFLFLTKINIKNISDENIENCIEEIKKKHKKVKVAATTMVQRKSALTAFFNYISITNIEKKDFSPLFKYLKKYNTKKNTTKVIKRKKGYTEDQQMKLVDRLLREHIASVKNNKRAKSKHTYYCALRDATLGLIMMYGGLRAEEAINLKFEDIKRDDDMYDIEILNGKGNKSRFTNIYAPLVENELSDLKRISPYQHLSSTRNNKPMAYSSLYKSTAKIIKPSGIDFNGLHAFRHTFASEMAKSGDVTIVAELLGHINLATTQIYIDINTERVKNAIRDVQCSANMEE